MNEIVNSSQFESVIKDGFVLVDFYSKGCAPCRAISMILDKMTSFFDESKVKVFKVDVENCLDKANELSVSAVPSVHLFKDGTRIDSFVGLKNMSQITSFVKQNL